MKIPEPIDAFIHATNTHNTNEFLAAFTDTAVISDEGHNYHGTAAIKEWFDEKCIAGEVTLEPIKAVERNGVTIVTIKVDGNFDKTGLPDPFQMDFHFTFDSGKVAALSIRLPQTRRARTYLKALSYWTV